MSRQYKLSKNSLLPSINYKQFISLVILLLVTASTTQTPSSSSSSSTQYVCPNGCECNIEDFSARCENLEALIASYSNKHSKKNFMPIKSLDLSNNQLTKISNQLELLVNLTELNLSHNHLSQVHKLNFEHLVKLDLSHNRITSAKLSKLPKNVVQLNLMHNEISYLPIDFMKLRKLRTLELSGNPLNCTCETLMVRNWISYQPVWSSNVIKCMSPPIFKGQPWLQARQNDICIEPSSTTERSISKYNWDNYDDNENMMADQPQVDEDNNGNDFEYENDEDNKPKDEYEEENDENDKDVFSEDAKPSDDDDKKVENTTNDDDNEDKVDELNEDFIPLAVVHQDFSSAESSSVSSVDVVEDESDGSGEEEPTSPENIAAAVTEEDDGSGKNLSNSFKFNSLLNFF